MTTILKTFTITLRNKYQVLADGRPAVEEDEEVEHDFQVMEKVSAEEVLGKPRRKKRKHGSAKNHGVF